MKEISINILTRRQFGELTLLYQNNIDKNKSVCSCNCGTIKSFPTLELKNGEICNCGDPKHHKRYFNII